MVCSSRRRSSPCRRTLWRRSCPSSNRRQTRRGRAPPSFAFWLPPARVLRWAARSRREMRHSGSLSSGLLCTCAIEDPVARSCSLSFARDPLSDVGRAMEELGSFPLARAQEADHIDIYDRDVLQIQDDLGTAHPHLVRDLAEMRRLHAPDQAEGGPLPIRAQLELQHPKPLIRPGRKESARQLVTGSNYGTGRKLLIDQKRMPNFRVGSTRPLPPPFKVAQPAILVFFGADTLIACGGRPWSR